MGVIGRLNQYGSMLAQEFDDYSMSENLVLYSSQIGITPNYTVAGTTELNTLATAAPNGLNEASLLDNIGNTGTNYVFGSAGISLAIGTTYTYSIYIKQGTKPDFQITIDENGFGGKRYYSSFTYSTETVTTGITGAINDGVVIGSTATKLPNGWYRLSLTFNTSTTNVGGFVDMINRFGNTSGSNYVWGRQLEYGSVATNYTPTTTTIINRILSPTVNTNITGKAYTRQNLLTYSEEFNNASWFINNSSISQNSVVAPDDSLTADKLIENNTNNQHVIYKPRTGSNETVTLSVFCKAAERTKVWLQLSNFSTATAQAIYNLSAGTASSPNANNADYTNSSTSIIAYPNGWYRCILTTTKGSVNTTNNPSISTADASNNLIYLGDGTSGVYIWGAQLEVSSTATNYMKTTAAAVSIPVAASTYFSSGFEENTGFTSTLAANVFSPYDPVYDDFAGALFGPGQGRYMRQTSNKSAIVYNEIDEVSDFRDIVRTGLVLDLDAAQPLSYNGSGEIWYDLSGNGFNATKTNVGGYGGQVTYNSAGYFDFSMNNPSANGAGNGAYFGNGFLLSNVAVPTVGSFTVNAFIKRNVTVNLPGDRETIFSNTGNTDGWRFGILTGGGIYYLIGGTSGVGYQEGGLGGSNLTDGNWHMMTAVFDRAAQLGSYTIYGYIDGVSSGNVSITAGAGGNVAFPSIAPGVGYGGCCDVFAGQIANVFAYNRALTATEVLKNFNALRHRFGI